MVLTETSCVPLGKSFASLGSVSPSINGKIDLDQLNSPSSFKKLLCDSYMPNKSNLLQSLQVLHEFSLSTPAHIILTLL